MFTKQHLERLIDVVRENPGLYDQSLPTYKDLQWTTNTWKKVATKFTDLEGSVDVETLRRKWKNKRDAYKKNKRRIETRKSGSAAEKPFKMEFYEQLSFLDPYIADRSTTSNVPESEVVFVSPDEDANEVMGGTELSTYAAISDEEDLPDIEEPLLASTPVAKRPNSRQETSSASISAPISQPASSTKKNKKGKESAKLDELIANMANSIKSTDAEISRLQEATAAQGDCDFYIMIGRRVSKMSPATQQWMEEQVWDLYMQAKRRDQPLPFPMPPSSTVGSSPCFPMPPSSTVGPSQPFPMPPSSTVGPSQPFPMPPSSTVGPSQPFPMPPSSTVGPRQLLNFPPNHQDAEERSAFGYLQGAINSCMY